MPVSDRPQDYTWGKRRNPWKIILPVAGIVIVVAVAGYFVFRGSASPTVTMNTSGGAALVPRLIDGVLVPRGQENIFPTVVIIENLVTVRPQSGLASANVVYEALAEGGITRFLAIFANSEDIPEIGPIRSARPYFVDWVKEYDALFAHEGGSPQALAAISGLSIRDLHAGRNSQYFWRDTKRQTAFEHTLFTSAKLLAFAHRDKGTPKEGAYAGWKFKSDAPESSRPTESKTITIDYSSFNYKVEYRYDRTANAYVRLQGGVEQKDAGGTAFAPKNVVVMYVKTRLIDKERLGMETIGSGEAIVFRDGQALTGTWRKDRSEDRLRFFTADGQETELNAGMTWVQVVPSDRTISYTP